MDYRVVGSTGSTGRSGVTNGDFGEAGGDGEDVFFTLSGVLSPGFGNTSIEVIGGRGGTAGKAWVGEYTPFALPGMAGDATISLNQVRLDADRSGATRLSATALGGIPGDGYTLGGMTSGNATVRVDGLTAAARSIVLDFGASVLPIAIGRLGSALVEVSNLNISNAQALSVSLGTFVGSQIGISDFATTTKLTSSTFSGTSSADIFSFNLSASFGSSSNFSGRSVVTFDGNRFSMGAGNDTVAISMFNTSIGGTPNILTNNVFDGGDGVDLLSIFSDTIEFNGYYQGPEITLNGNTYTNFEFLDLNGSLSYIGALSNYMRLPTLNGRTVAFDLAADGAYHQVVAQQDDVAIKTGDAGSSIRLTTGYAVIVGGSGRDVITFGTGQATVTGGKGGQNTYIFDRANMHQSTTGDDGLIVITDFHTKAGEWRPDNDFIYLKGFAGARIDYVRDVAGSPDKHVYGISDGAFYSEFIIQLNSTDNYLNPDQVGRFF